MAQFEKIVYPKEFQYPGMLILSSCQEELKAIVEASSEKARLKSDYESRLKILDQYRREAPGLNRQWFERLKYDNEFFSMRFKGKDNLRILYTFRGTNVFLLCAFVEKKGDDYKHYISLAKMRTKQIGEE